MDICTGEGGATMHCSHLPSPSLPPPPKNVHKVHCEVDCVWRRQVASYLMYGVMCGLMYGPISLRVLKCSALLSTLEWVLVTSQVNWGESNPCVPRQDVT